MNTKFTRRQTLTALGTMALAAGALAVGARRSTPELHTKPWRQIAMEVLSGPPVTRELMLAMPAPRQPATAWSVPAPRGVSWSDEGCVYEHPADLKKAVQSVRDRVREDLDSGRVVLTGGWVLSQTEAALVAMCVESAAQISEGRP